VSDCHYRRLATSDGYLVFESTPGTASNWDAEIQHGSPPLALLTRAVEDLYLDRPELRVGRLVLDILGAIPVAPVRVRAWVERPGARITMAVAEMRTVEGAVVAPLLTPDGCIGVLSAEMKGGSEKDESSQALATIFAAQLATIVATPPALPVKAVAQG